MRGRQDRRDYTYHILHIFFTFFVQSGIEECTAVGKGYRTGGLFDLLVSWLTNKNKFTIFLQSLHFLSRSRTQKKNKCDLLVMKKVLKIKKRTNNERFNQWWDVEAWLSLLLLNSTPQYLHLSNVHTTPKHKYYIKDKSVNFQLFHLAVQKGHISRRRRRPS